MKNAREKNHKASIVEVQQKIKEIGVVKQCFLKRENSKSEARSRFGTRYLPHQNRSTKGCSFSVWPLFEKEIENHIVQVIQAILFLEFLNHILARDLNLNDWRSREASESTIKGNA